VVSWFLCYYILSPFPISWLVSFIDPYSGMFMYKTLIFKVKVPFLSHIKFCKTKWIGELREVNLCFKCTKLPVVLVLLCICQHICLICIPFIGLSNLCYLLFSASRGVSWVICCFIYLFKLGGVGGICWKTTL
jgi:hypothetical protein